MLYIHIPFCHRKCSYCAFFSKVTDYSPARYVEALCCELEQRGRGELSAPLGSKIHTVYFGGGTPSLLPVELIGRIVDTIARCYDLSELEEATLECNPEDVSPGFLQQLERLHFFNRLSIGVQSLHDDDLRRLNRRHSSRQATDAINCAVENGIKHLSVDLIYGLPYQSVAKWCDVLDQLISCHGFHGIDHLSAYALTVEPGTMLERQLVTGRIEAATEDMQLEHYRLLKEWLAGSGFEQYEVSNFARPGGRSRHNSRYWQRVPYMGVGASAHSFDGATRSWNVSDIGRYVEGVEHGCMERECETLTPDDAYNEYIMTALRTTEGIDKSMVHQRYAARLSAKAAPFVQRGLLVETASRYVPTESGLLMADGMAAELFV